MGSLLHRHPLKQLAQVAKSNGRSRILSTTFFNRRLHSSPTLYRVQPYILADIGEGITECQVVSWYVKPGDQVAQFDPICEVQSDKATVEVTSRYDGVIKSLHYEQDDTAIVGKPLLDMDIMEEHEENETGMFGATDPETLTTGAVETDTAAGLFHGQQQDMRSSSSARAETSKPVHTETNENTTARADQQPLLTPAVRYLLKQNNIEAREIQGTGKSGRITKDDVTRHLQGARKQTQASVAVPLTTADDLPRSVASTSDHTISLSTIERQMFKTMTRSLAIPQFLYTHSIDVTALNGFRQKHNQAQNHEADSSTSKLSLLPFVMKALSLAFLKYPRLNSHLIVEDDATNPRFVLRKSHNFGIAVETPQGLLVPVVKDVQNQSIESIANEVKRLAALSRAGKLQPHDFSDATFTISNIGSIGGDVVHPVIVSPMTGIVGIGRTRHVPAFETDDSGTRRVVEREQVTLSWSADHRVLDGATVARTAEAAGKLLETVDSWAIRLV